MTALIHERPREGKPTKTRWSIAAAAAYLLLLLDGAAYGQSSGVSVDVTTGKTMYGSGEAVPIKITLMNSGTRIVNVTTTDACYLSFEVRTNGRGVYSFSKHVACAQVIFTFELAPGKNKSVTYMWKQVDDQNHTVSPGTYEVIATFSGGINGGPEILAGITTLTIVSQVASAQTSSTSGPKPSGGYTSPPTIGLDYIAPASAILALGILAILFFSVRRKML